MEKRQFDGWAFGLAALNGSALVGGSTVISGVNLGKWGSMAAWGTLGAKAIGTGITAVSMFSDFNNATRILAGKYYSDPNISFGKQLVQGISRQTWEVLQSWGGYNYTQLRNVGGGIDRVDYFGGATFATGENSVIKGISLSNYLNVWIKDEIDEPFRNKVIGDPLFMHEYGHTFDSRIFGPLYLFGVGLPSAAGAEWTELRANSHAGRYFGKHFGIDWTIYDLLWPRK